MQQSGGGNLVEERGHRQADDAADVGDPLLEMLRQCGVILKVDDFGTGPSSLSYLQHCPVDVLKIDQSFVREILPATTGAPLVRAVIALGKGLGCRVVAEGVETRHQLKFLRDEMCDEGQGYHFSPAVDADAFGRLLSMAPFAVPPADRPEPP